MEIKERGRERGDCEMKREVGRRERRRRDIIVERIWREEERKREREWKIEREREVG